jgi:geranylgeranyl pyrophosphate synthase
LSTHRSLQLISSDLHQVEEILHATAGSGDTSLGSMSQMLMDAGGKRIRPAITLLTGRLLQAPEQPLFQLAAAIEMTHTATLIHDDLVDQAETRRGQSTLHMRVSAGMAVLAGDYLFAQAARLVAATGRPALVERFSTMLTVMVRGEVDQFAGRGVIPAMETYHQRIYAKTAAMFEAGCACAALLIDAPEGIVTAAGRYGREVGIAFQIMDDLLDFSGDQVSIGKPAQQDLFSGTFNLPVVLYQQEHPDDPDLAAIQIATGKQANSAPIDLAIVQRLVLSIRKSGALAHCALLADEHAKSAAQGLQVFPASPYRDALEQFAAEASHRVF